MISEIKQFTVGMEEKAEEVSQEVLKQKQMKLGKREGNQRTTVVVKYPNISSRKKIERKQRGGNEQEN